MGDYLGQGQSKDYLTDYEEYLANKKKVNNNLKDATNSAKDYEKQKEKLEKKPNKTIQDKKRLEKLEKLLTNKEAQIEGYKKQMEALEETNEAIVEENRILKEDNQILEAENRKLKMLAEVKYIQKINSSVIQLAIKLIDREGKPINELIPIKIEVVRIKEEKKGREEVLHITGEKQLALNFLADENWHAFYFEASSDIFRKDSAYEIFIKYQDKTINNMGYYIKNISKTDFVEETIVVHNPKISERKNDVKETIEVDSAMVQIKIKDSRGVDGDVVSLFLNDGLVLFKMMLKGRYIHETIELKQPESILTFVAESTGNSDSSCTIELVINGQDPIFLESSYIENQTVIIKLKDMSD